MLWGYVQAIVLLVHANTQGGGTTMREHYAQQLAGLRDDLLRLGSMVEHALNKAMQSLETWDIVTAAQIINDDSYINNAQHAAEERAIALIATQQPVAGDLRLLANVAAIAIELERIGDYACTIARRIRRAAQRPVLIPPPPALYEMAALAQTMLHTSLDAFLHHDVNLARSLQRDDERVDAFEDSLRMEFTAIAQADSQKVGAVIDLLEVVHTLERVADRATNIGERVIYMATCRTEELNP